MMDRLRVSNSGIIAGQRHSFPHTFYTNVSSDISHLIINRASTATKMGLEILLKLDLSDPQIFLFKTIRHIQFENLKRNLKKEKDLKGYVRKIKSIKFKITTSRNVRSQGLRFSNCPTAPITTPKVSDYIYRDMQKLECPNSGCKIQDCRRRHICTVCEKESHKAN